jgi:predicted ATPase/DNA-binding CsgD family transcriptional regulator
MKDLSGQQMGNYRIIRLLGIGGFADVYLGEHRYLNKQVAMKILHTQLNPTAVENFLCEARHLSQLAHPHIIHVLDFGFEEETPFLVMDYAPGGTLRERHPKGVTVALPTVVSYASAVASALHYVHGQGLIHRDLKPENLLVGRNDEILLSDFGIALLAPTTVSLQIPEVFGSLAYMAPEQIRGAPQPASDQYALAVLVYEWLCGDLPFRGSASELYNRHLSAAPASIQEKNPTISPAVEQVVLQALSKDPESRFMNSLSFAEALAEASYPGFAQYAFQSQLFPARAGSNTGVVNSCVHYNNLPEWLTQLIGREGEVQAACVLLDRPEVRLLTMTGAGGIGKTKLALQVGADLLKQFAHGVCWVSLSAITDPKRVLPTIAHTLGLHGSTHRSYIERLNTYLRDKHLLLILDNFEQILPAAPLLSTLLASCPLLKVLVTSRAKLHLQGEYEFQVAPLDLPDLKHLSTCENLIHYSAIALFVKRAQEINLDFQLTEENAHLVAEICVRLNGLPLAIELAAARLKLLSLRGLYPRLEQQLSVLTGGKQDAPQRQQTLRNTIQWSYDLLTSEEQYLFRLCCVFVKGFTLEAVEAICKSVGDLRTPVFDLLKSLIDKSLILLREQGDDEPRLSLLHAIREYGMELLIASGDLEQARMAFAEFYLRLAEEAEPAFNGPMQAVWLRRQELELENFRAALHILLEHARTEMALRLAAALQHLWMLGGYLSQGLYFLEQGVKAHYEGKSPVPANVLAKALYIAGWLAYWQNDPERATAFLSESSSLSRSLEDQRVFADVLFFQGNIAYNRGDIQLATAMHDESLRLYREIGNRKGAAEILLVMGANALYLGKYKQAHELCEECLALVRDIGNAWNIAVNLHYLGWTVFMLGDIRRARQLCEESVAIFETLGKSVFAVESRIMLAYIVEALGEETTARTFLEEALALGKEMESQDDIGRVLCGLGHLALRQGDLALARSQFEESIALLKGRWLSPRNKWVLASCLERVGEIALVQGRPAWTVHLFAIAETIRRAHGYYSPLGIEHSLHDRTLARARAQLGKQNFAALWAEGQSMSLEQVLTTWTKEENALSKPLISPVPAPTSTPVANLTRRQYEVLRLVAKGLTNTQIAEQLVVSMSTVDTHIQSIYGKLGVSSRVRATRYAIEHDLV